MSANTPSIEPQEPARMFSISSRKDLEGRIIVMGKATRKRVDTSLNVPLCQATRDRLEERLVGSLAMGTSALIEWAIDELTRRRITLEVRAEK